jgi:ABC-type transport system involved in cytochrome bd biosynthesis fused ATPase/permease subunit
MKKEYTMHLDQMKQTFEKELHMKTAELEDCIAEIQNEKDKYRAELDYMREENKVTNKQQEQVIETERHDYKTNVCFIWSRCMVYSYFICNLVSSAITSSVLYWSTSCAKLSGLGAICLSVGVLVVLPIFAYFALVGPTLCTIIRCQYRT